MDIVGVIRWPEPAGWFVGAYNAHDDLWFARDPLAMAAQKQWGAVAPFTIEQETPVPQGGVPRPGRLRVDLPNHHLQYALTWFALALVLLAMFAFWLRGRRAERRFPAGGA
jgi:surfeit locus 1 family protein